MVWENPEGLPVIYTKGVGFVAALRMEPMVSGNECDANAALIAAAPDLLEACNEVRMFGLTARVQAILEAAIAKAEGSK